jgi:hypothetical protein
MAPGIISRRSVHEPYKQVYLQLMQWFHWTWSTWIIIGDPNWKKQPAIDTILNQKVTMLYVFMLLLVRLHLK